MSHVAGSYHCGMNLQKLHAKLNREERIALAEAAGITPRYLSQLASGFRRNPSIRMCAAMVDHDSRLTIEELADEFSEYET